MAFGAGSGSPSRSGVPLRYSLLFALASALAFAARPAASQPTATTAAAAGTTTAETPPPSPVVAVTADENGFGLRSSDGAFALRLRGDAQADGRFFVDDVDELGVDQFYLRRARILLQGTLGGRYDFRLQPNFGQGRVEIQDAYLDARFSTAFAVEAGKFKVPLGLEWLRSPTDLALVELGLPSALVPRRDVGVMAHGAVARGRLTYEVGLFDGALDGQNADSDVSDGKDVAARLFAQPFRASAGPLRGLGVGVAATYGKDDGTVAAPEVAGYRTTGGRPIFRYRATSLDSTTALADGRRLRYSPQAYFFSGPVSLLTEYVASSQNVRIGGQATDLQASAWQVAGTVLLTGEDATFGRLRPARPFGAQGGFGALELAARYGALTADEDAFPAFANPATSARTARAWAAGVNWYPSSQVRLMVNVERTTFEMSEAAADAAALPAETLVLTRFQIAF